MEGEEKQMAHLRVNTPDAGRDRRQRGRLDRDENVASQVIAQEIQVWHSLHTDSATRLDGLLAHHE